MSKGAMKVSLSGYEMTVDEEKLTGLHEVEEHASWAPSQLDEIANELIRIGSDDGDVNHRKYISYIRNLRDIRDDFLFIRTLDVSKDGEIPYKGDDNFQT